MFVCSLWRIFPWLDYEKYINYIIINERYSYLDTLYNKFETDNLDNTKWISQNQLMMLNIASKSTNKSILIWGYQKILIKMRDWYDADVINMTLLYQLRIYTLCGKKVLFLILSYKEHKKLFQKIIDKHFFYHNVIIPYKLQSLFDIIDDHSFIDKMVDELEYLRDATRTTQIIKYVNYTKIRDLVLIAQIIGNRGYLTANKDLTRIIFSFLK